MSGPHLICLAEQVDYSSFKTLTMKNIYIILALTILSSCSERKAPKADAIENELQRLDSLKGDFSPDYFTDTEKAHRSFQIAFDGSSFAIVPGSESLRPGNPPFNGKDQSGPYLMTFRDAAGQTIFSYSLDHPGVLRACEGENPKAELQDSFSFEVMAPARLPIASIALTTKDKVIFESNIPRQQPGSTDSVVIR